MTLSKGGLMPQFTTAWIPGTRTLLFSTLLLLTFIIVHKKTPFLAVTIHTGPGSLALWGRSHPCQPLVPEHHWE